MTITYIDAIARLHSHGYHALAMSALGHYERMTAGMDAGYRCRVSQMFDEVLNVALRKREDISAADILISPDFVTIRALARLLQDLKLVEYVVEMDELDVARATFEDFSIAWAEPGDYVELGVAPGALSGAF